LWDTTAVVVDLGTVGNSPGTSGANGINRPGQVVGYSTNGGNVPHACIWTNGAVTDLDPAGQWGSAANAINDAGLVVGYQTLGSAQRATLWQNGTAVDLGVLPGVGNGLTPWSWAVGINNKGQIVGSTGIAGLGPMRAFIWQNGTMTDLNTLIPDGSDYVIVGATGINDAGQIIAGASRSDGSGHAVLLIPR
jgi:probable HAF family extracellular repeat protein